MDYKLRGFLSFVLLLFNRRDKKHLSFQKSRVSFFNHLFFSPDSVSPFFSRLFTCSCCVLVSNTCTSSVTFTVCNLMHCDKKISTFLHRTAGELNTSFSL